MIVRGTMRLLLAAAALSLGCAATPPRPLPPTPGRAHFGVLTYNVNFGIAGDPETIGVVRRSGAEIVLLQETNEAWEEAIRRDLGGLYAHMLFRHCCRAGGLAVLSRFPVTEGDYIPSPSGWFPAWRVIVRAAGGPLQVLSVHLHPAVSESGSWMSGAYRTPRVRLAEIRRFMRSVDPGLPTLVVGDFNEGDGGHSLAFVEAQGFSSALPAWGGPQSTWRWPTPVGTLRLQLDHVFHNALLRPLDVRVLRGGRSDHLAVFGRFERRHGSFLMGRNASRCPGASNRHGRNASPVERHRVR